MSTAVKERPILFSAPMILAIREGRKTQTRRVMTPPPPSWARAGGRMGLPGAPPRFHFTEGRGKYGDKAEKIGRMCRYGSPGDKLWVRETLRRDPDCAWTYAADDEPVTVAVDAAGRAAMVAWAHHKEGDVCVSIHMPRWASRFTLEITDVRVERLQAITEEDARAEGMTPTVFTAEDVARADSGSQEDQLLRALGPGSTTHLFEFQLGWDAINGKRPGCSWESNPWVWVVAFRRLERAA